MLNDMLNDMFNDMLNTSVGQTVSVHATTNNVCTVAIGLHACWQYSVV